MRFERVHRLVTYAVTALPLAVLAFSGELGLLFPLLFVPAWLLSIPASRRYQASTAQPERVGLWNAVLVLGLLACAGAAVLTTDWLRYAIYFASLMVTVRLFQQRTSRDFFQLYLLSFIQLVAGAVINPTLTFALAFLAYVVLITWALVLLHFRRDLEELAQREGRTESQVFGGPRLQRLVTPSFLGASSGLALIMFIASVGVFLIFPRVGLGLFGAHRQSGQSVSGFDDQVTLGDFGTIKTDQTVVARIEATAISTPGLTLQSLLPLRLRGMVFDQYDGHSWAKTTKRREPLRRVAEGGFWEVRREPRELPENAHRFELSVFMEPIRMDRKAVFGEHRLVAVRDVAEDRYEVNPRRRTSYSRDDHGDVLYDSPDSAPPRYRVRSIRFPRDPVALRAVSPVDPSHPDVAPFLQLPSALDPRIPALAREITAGEATPFDKAAAIERYLLGNYAYSLDGGHDPEDPLADFLFGKKAGHCEYFSTAFIILARSVGIPSRSVGGFYGGVYNSVGDYASIRQADAHSWAEALFPGEGWEVFDATPPGGSLVPEEEGLWARLSSYVDSIQLAWYKWVVGFDLDDQVSMFKEIGKGLEGAGLKLPKWREIRAWFRMHWPAVLLGALLFLLLAVVLAALWRRQRPRRARVTSRRVTGADARRVRRLYRRLERAARRRGVDLSTAPTAGRLLAALRRQSPAAADAAAQVSRVYEAVLFGNEPLHDHDYAAARSAAASLEAAHIPR